LPEPVDPTAPETTTSVCDSIQSKEKTSGEQHEVHPISYQQTLQALEQISFENIASTVRNVIQKLVDEKNSLVHDKNTLNGRQIESKR
jgi:hypothetical protein